MRYRYTKEQEDKLIADAAHIDLQATAILYEQYHGLIINEINKKYIRSILSSDDAASIARLAFYEAIDDYDSERGIHFAGFLQSRIHAALYTAFRRERRWNDNISDMELTDDMYITRESPERIVVRRLYLHPAIQILNHKERWLIYTLYWRDMQQIRIARALQVTRQTIGQRTKRALAKMRKELTTAC